MAKTAATKTKADTADDLISFGSVDDLLACALDGPEARIPSHDARIDAWLSDRSDLEWNGLGTMRGRDTVTTLRNGWPEGAQRIAEGVGSIEAPALVSVRRRVRRGSEGDEVDMQRVWAGDLDHAWARCVPVSVVAPRRVRIIVDMCANGMANARELFWRGAAGVALGDALCEAGYGVTMASAFAADESENGRTGRYGRWGVYVTTKPYEAPFSAVAMAAATACAGFFRVAGFAAMARLARRERSNTLGTPLDLLACDLIPADPGALTLVVGPRVMSADAARAWVAASIATLETGAPAPAGRG